MGFHEYLPIDREVGNHLGIRKPGDRGSDLNSDHFEDWSKIIEPRDADLDALAGMLKDLKTRRRNVWVFVNNHFEGCGPLTIERIRGRLPGTGRPHPQC